MRIAAWLCGVLALAAAAEQGRGAVPCPAAAEALPIRGSTLCVRLRDAPSGQRTVLREWVERSAAIVADYYGRFPSSRVLIELESTDGDRVGGGRTTDEGMLRIRVTVGRAATSGLLSSDWVLVHEMVHLALPDLGRRHDWLAEGLAVYVEGVARAQFGNRSAADVWAEDRRSMPMGLPRSGEGGMDQTPTWARTYWGGALFCLQAEIAIRERTGNRAGLQSALRAILNRTGGYGFEWPIEEVLKIGDEATGTRVLEDQYRDERESPRTTDLDLLWRRLGVPPDPTTQPFDDEAPLAAIRAAITAPPSTARGMAPG